MILETLFNKAAQHYDDTHRILVPCFDDLYGTALQLLPSPSTQELHILDIGAGTGLLSGLITEQCPNAQLTLIDLASDMLARAAERLHPYGERIHILHGDMTQIRSLGAFDLVVSALAIHHLNDAHKQKLFEDIHALLRSGGRFINVEQILGPTPAIERQYETIWLQTVRAKGISPEDVTAAQERMGYDKCAPLSLQLQWLTDVGFEQVNCWYQWYRFATYSGDKA